MSLFALNLDILDCILALVDPYDAFCLSLTCREAQKIAIPRVLERVEFPLPWVWRYRSKRPLVASWNLYNSFAVYTLADAPQRLWCLRDLILGENTFCVSFSDPMDLTRPPRFDFTLVGPLIDVIHGAVQLRRLSIERSEDLFSCVPLLTDAIASLPRLQEVRFRQADTITLSLLSRLKSRPHTVEVRLQQYINWETNHQCWGQYVAGKHRFLNNFTESLEVLELDGGSAVIKALEPHTVWSTVRELTLNRGESANLYVLANAFPNLRRLHVEPPPTKHVPPSDRWQELDFVHSQNPLPLQHPVRHIEIDWFLKPLQAVTPYEQAETAATIAMLQKTQPIVLQCHAGKHVYSCIAQHAPSVRFLQVIAAPEWRPPFTSFAIHKVTDEKATAVLTEEFSILRSVPLVGIAVEFKPPEATCSWDVAKREEYARVIASCIPTLEHVGLRHVEVSEHLVYGPPQAEYSSLGGLRKPYRWYQVVRRKGEQDVVELSEEMGDLVQAALFRAPSVGPEAHGTILQARSLRPAYPVLATSKH